MSSNSQRSAVAARPVPLVSMLDRRGRPPVLERHVDLDDWAGGIPQERARVPKIRIGRRWVNTLWLLPIGVAALSWRSRWRNSFANTVGCKAS